MSSRRILHHGPTPSGTPVLLSDRAIAGCWFELHRQGGCGPGELTVQRQFAERKAIEVGDWISCEAQPGERWYLGRVEECRFQFPGMLRLRLTGMGIELNEIFPGGFRATPDPQRPLRYGGTDLFSNDPDRGWERAYPVTSIQSLVRTLLEQHLVGQSHIQYDRERVEAPVQPVAVDSLKFRGEESLRSILKDLALRAQASWGVDSAGQFFFLRRSPAAQTVLRMGRDLTSLEEIRDRELLFNRLLLTGDYIYDQRDNSGHIARRVYRWRGNFFEPDSCRDHGNRRLKLWVPWIRTQPDSLAFARSFFRTYAEPTCRFSVETGPQSSPIIPWLGPVTLEDSSGETLASGYIEKVRVLFDHAPRMRLEIGPEDPRELWAEPPQDERWELPDHIPSHGGEVSVTDQPSERDDNSTDNPPPPPPPPPSDRFSDSSSRFSSLGSSDESSLISEERSSSSANYQSSSGHDSDESSQTSESGLTTVWSGRSSSTASSSDQSSNSVDSTETASDSSVVSDISSASGSSSLVSGETSEETASSSRWLSDSESSTNHSEDSSDQAFSSSNSPGSSEESPSSSSSVTASDSSSATSPHDEDSSEDYVTTASDSSVPESSVGNSSTHSESEESLESHSSRSPVDSSEWDSSNFSSEESTLHGSVTPMTSGSLTSEESYESSWGTWSVTNGTWTSETSTNGTWTSDFSH